MSAERIEKQAADWFEKRLSGGWTQADQAAFEVWLETSCAHEIQYLRIKTAWGHIARLQALGAGVAAGEIPPRHAWGDARFFRGAASGRYRPARRERDHCPVPSTAHAPRRGKVGNWPLLASAAMVTLAAVGIYLYQTHWDVERYATPVGGLRNLALGDGSHITLNTDTSLRVSFDGRERRIDLDKGEAFFDVAEDPGRPFIVAAGDQRIIVVGTEFSVRRDTGAVRVVVAEGKVRIEERQDASNENAAARLIAAGAVAHVSRTGVQIREDGDAAVENLLSWRSGYVNFDNVPLAEAVAEFNRYRESKILIEDAAIAGLRIGGNFRSDNSEAFLAVLETGFSIEVQRRDGAIALKRHSRGRNAGF
jgi:transmembrane sensor